MYYNALLYILIPSRAPLEAYRYDAEINERNAPMTDEELDAIFPQTGYEIVRPPANYNPIRKSVLSSTPTPRAQK